MFRWARFRSTKAGVKLHTQIDVVTHIPSFYDITEAAVHDVNFLDEVHFEPLAAYILDRGYWDLSRLFRIESANSFFVIREKSRPKYEIIAGEDMLDGGNVLLDQTVRFVGKRNADNYPLPLRRVVAYIPELHRSLVFYTNNMYLKADEVALLYKNRWQVELFFKWIKQHLRVKRFWGDSEPAVKIQINVAIATYCLIAIIEKQLSTNRNIYEVMRILGSSLLTKDNIRDLLVLSPTVDTAQNRQLEFEFASC